MGNHNMTSRKSIVLAIDDTPANLRALGSALRNGKRGYAVLVLSLVGRAKPEKPQVDTAAGAKKFITLLGEDARTQMRLLREMSSARTAPPALLTEPVGTDPARKKRTATVEQILCRRIVELDAGQLKLAYLPIATPVGGEQSHLESFALTLRTGLPPKGRNLVDCSQCRINLQTQAFATNISQMLSKN
jgi:hypothetical protein